MGHSVPMRQQAPCPACRFSTGCGPAVEGSAAVGRHGGSRPGRPPRRNTRNIKAALRQKLRAHGSEIRSADRLQVDGPGADAGCDNGRRSAPNECRRVRRGDVLRDGTVVNSELGRTGVNIGAERGRHCRELGSDRSNHRGKGMHGRIHRTDPTLEKLAGGLPAFEQLHQITATIRGRSRRSDEDLPIERLDHGPRQRQCGTVAPALQTSRKRGHVKTNQLNVRRKATRAKLRGIRRSGIGRIRRLEPRKIDFIGLVRQPEDFMEKAAPDGIEPRIGRQHAAIGA